MVLQEQPVHTQLIQVFGYLVELHKESHLVLKLHKASYLIKMQIKNGLKSFQLLANLLLFPLSMLMIYV